MASLIIGPPDWAGVARTVAEYRVTVHPAIAALHCLVVRTARSERGELQAAARAHGNTPTTQRVASYAGKKAAWRKAEAFRRPSRLGVEHTMSWFEEI